MAILKFITQSGLVETDSYKNKRALILTNYISLLLCAILLVLYLIRITLFRHVTFALDASLLIIGFTIFSLPILLNKWHFPDVSKLVLCLGTVGFTWYAFVSRMQLMTEVGPHIYDSLRIYILAFSPLPFLVFNRRRPEYLTLIFLVTILSILFFEVILGYFGVNSTQKGMVLLDYEFMQVRTVIGYLIISGACFSFQSIITLNDEYNEKLMGKIKRKSEEIEAQNQRIVEKQGRLNKTNFQLASMVAKSQEDIEFKNKKLENYAFTNSHRVRGPVARLLGLIHLSKIEDQKNYPIIFEKIEQESKEIDEIIRTITKELNN